MGSNGLNGFLMSNPSGPNDTWLWWLMQSRLCLSFGIYIGCKVCGFDVHVTASRAYCQAEQSSVWLGFRVWAYVLDPELRVSGRRLLRSGLGILSGLVEEVCDTIPWWPRFRVLCHQPVIIIITITVITIIVLNIITIIISTKYNYFNPKALQARNPWTQTSQTTNSCLSHKPLKVSDCPSPTCAVLSIRTALGPCTTYYKADIMT